MRMEDPKIESSATFRFLTSIWIVPVVALIIAGWLAWQHYAKLGPEITIVFPKNEGLVAGQSVIKYKDVPVGKIVRIDLGEEGDGVIIQARMNKEAEGFLNDDTKFWIVKPEVGVTGVSGLETLLSGTYIEMHGKKGAFTKRRFYGLTHAYRNIGEGEYFHLQAPQAYNVLKGTPVYFKNIKVGQVEYVTVSLDGKTVDFIIFVDKLYVPYIHTDSKFWVMSALDVDFSSGRLDVNVAPIGHLVHSGIAFSSSGEDLNDTVPDDYVFFLYKNQALANQKKIGKGGKHTKRYKIFVRDSVAKLSPGAPVRYQGFEVGRVKEIAVDYNRSDHTMAANLIVDIDISSFADETYNGQANFQRAIKEGLRARIASTDPITGILYIDLIFTEDNRSDTPKQSGALPVIPSVPMAQSSILDGTERLLEKLNAIPLQSTFEKLNKAIEDTDKILVEAKRPLVESLQALKSSLKAFEKLTKQKDFKGLPKRLKQTLRNLDVSLKKADAAMASVEQTFKDYQGDSVMAKRLSETLKSVNETSLEMKRFLKMLNRKPNSLIFGDH